MYTMSYIVSTFLLSMSLVFATPNSGPTLLLDHPSPVASTNLLELLAVYGASYSNIWQLAGENNETGEHHSFINLYLIPVDIPAFSKDKRITAVLGEELNGAVYRKELLEFIEEENEVIRAKRYNLTSNSEPIEQLQPEMLDTNPECDALIEKVESAVYTVSYPNCRSNREGQSYPLGVGIITCWTHIVYIPAHAAEIPSALPYFFKKTARFPLPEYLFRDKYSDYTYDFVDPC